jgi:REP element-mobilizing transposase RayT
MPTSYIQLHYHIVFGTKLRRPVLTDGFRKDLHGYIGGIIDGKNGQILEIGSTDDHIHLLTSCSPRIALADFIRDIKSNSSKWVHQERGLLDFEWQEGYGAFTVSHSLIADVQKYVANQAEHHRRLSFADEFRAFLSKHGIVFDERYLFEREHHG